MGTINGNELRFRHRKWAFDGLRTPPGVALVRPTRPRSALPQRILIVGDETAQAIGPPLVRLSRDAKVGILVVARPGAPAVAWIERGWIVSAVGRCRPDLLLLAFRADQPVADVDRIAVVAGVRAVLSLAADPDAMPEVGRPVPLPESPDIAPTALGYAAWAGEVWHTLSHPV